MSWPYSCPNCDRHTSIDLGPFADETHADRAWYNGTGHCRGCGHHPYQILKFDGPFFFLSNFYDPAPVEYLGAEYPTTEHAYQAAKSNDPMVRKRIREAKSARESKKMGRRVTLRHDWEEVKDAVMLELLRRKFKIPELREKLLDTGTAYLEEGNWWKDRYWGVCEGTGLNKLGLLLMQVRSEIRSEGDPG